MGRPGRKQDRLKQHLGVITDPSVLDLVGISAAMREGCSPEESYCQVVPLEHRRKYAQFFTPPKVARLMAEWALENGAKSLMDPALGMGSLLRAALAQKTDLEVTAFERDPIILQAYLKTQPARRNIKVLLGDFLSFDTVSRFDAVLMNPPYLRHHDIAYEFDIFANFSKLCSIDVSRLSNIYVLFTLKAIMSLRPGGRASILIPTEWMNANFGHALKTFLIERNVLKEIIYFSHCSEIFDDALTTACVLLLEKELP